MAGFNINSPYAQVADATGRQMFLQGGNFFLNQAPNYPQVQFTTQATNPVQPLPQVDPTGSQLVALPASQLFVDTFDTGLDTTNLWTATAGGTGIAATNTVGATVLDGGTTLNSFSKLSSVPSFKPTQPGFLLSLKTINVESPVVLTAHRFWGQGTSSATPTIASPLIQGIGYEIGIDGVLHAVTYQTGTRADIANLATVQPSDNKAHKYFYYFKGDIAYWCIDNQYNVVASFNTGASGPDINGLPLLVQVVSNSGTHATLQVNGVTLGDTAHTGVQIVDGTFGFRKLSILANGGFSTSPLDGAKATYSASFTGLVGVVGDIFTIYGSATKTVRITRMCFTGIATAAATMDLQIIKRSAVNTVGTSTGAAACPHDSTSAAATATVLGYTAAPTPGAAVGTPIRSVKVDISAAASQEQLQEWNFGNGPKQSVVLRGVAQGLCMAVSATQAGALYDVDVEWTEE